MHTVYSVEEEEEKEEAIDQTLGLKSLFFICKFYVINHVSHFFLFV